MTPAQRLSQIAARWRAALPGRRILSPDGIVVQGRRRVLDIDTRLTGPMASALRGTCRADASLRWDAGERIFTEQAHDDVKALLDLVERRGELLKRALDMLNESADEVARIVHPDTINALVDELAAEIDGKKDVQPAD